MEKIFGLIYILFAVLIHFITIPIGTSYFIWLLPQILLLVVGLIKIIR